MTKTRVSRHPRKGTKGVKSHNREVIGSKTVPHFSPNYDKVLEWKENYGIEHYNLNMAEEALFDNIERAGFLVQKLDPRTKYKYLTNEPGAKKSWIGHRNLSELDAWYDRVKGW